MKTARNFDNYHDYESARITFKPLSSHMYTSSIIYSMSKSFLETETSEYAYLTEELQSKLRILAQVKRWLIYSFFQQKLPIIPKEEDFCLSFCNFRSYNPNSHKASNKNAPIAATAPIAAVMMISFNAFLRGLR